MKKDTKTLVLALIGGAVGLAALVVWLVVCAITTGFYSTKIELGTEEQGKTVEGVQAWNKFLTAKVTLNYDKFFQVDGDNYIFVNSGVTNTNYTDYKNVNVVSEISLKQRVDGDVAYDSQTKYYTVKSQSYELAKNLDSTNWTDGDFYGTLYVVEATKVTTKPSTTISVEPAAQPAFWPSSFDGIEIVFTFKPDTDTERSEDVTVSIDKKGYGSVDTSTFNVGASINSVTVKSVKGSVVKK